VTLRLAMWSGPRNISTAMMRAWENRADCAVIDEPFYACYLAESGANHPCREAVMQSQPIHRSEVISGLVSDEPAPIYYQKHMTHHMPADCDLSWAVAMHHVFLIRDPAAVIASYLNKMPTVTADDIGIVRQWELYHTITELTGKSPTVIDSADVLSAPAAMLSKLCAALDVPWQEHEMITWPSGPRISDGVWAQHWYQSVWASTGFSAPTAQAKNLSGAAQSLAQNMRPYYQALAINRLTANGSVV
jgi:hypothetical protein